jgi:general stress protein 26
MERLEIDFLDLEREAIHYISQSSVWVLATASGPHVTARTVFTVSNGVVIFFMTDRNLLKYKQLTMNPIVALCRENYSIEGKAKDIGSPMDLKNSTVANLYRQHHPLAYKRFASLNTETLIEVHPTLISIWKQTDRQTVRDTLQLVAKKAYRDVYLTYSL